MRLDVLWMLAKERTTNVSQVCDHPFGYCETESSVADRFPICLVHCSEPAIRIGPEDIRLPFHLSLSLGSSEIRLHTVPLKITATVPP